MEKLKFIPQIHKKLQEENTWLPGRLIDYFFYLLLFNHTFFIVMETTGKGSALYQKALQLCITHTIS